MYTISQRISNLKDIEVLAKEEIEKMVKINISKFEIPLIYPSSNINEPITPIID